MTVLDADKVRALGIEVLDPSELGADELLTSGMSRHEAHLEIALRACRELGVERALVPPEFPLAVADHLRAGGIDARGGARDVRRAPADEDRRAARRDPARAEGGRRRDGRRRAT